MKYELVPSDIPGLFRVKAIKDFNGVEAGELGGYVQYESNLSQTGNAWIYGNARVQGDARIHNNARIFDTALISDNAQIYDNATVHDSVQIFGNAIVCDSAQVFGNARITKCLYVQQKKYSITATDTHCFIGCEGRTWEDWFASITQIGYKYNYTEQEIELTRQLLRIIYQQITNWETQ